MDKRQAKENRLYQHCKDKNWDAVREYLAADDERRKVIAAGTGGVGSDTFGKGKVASKTISSSSPSRSQKPTPPKVTQEEKKRAIMCYPTDDHDISTIDTSNRHHSCLHEACDRGAPADVVKMMIDIVGKDLTKIKDNHGRTALLIACGRSGACYDSIKVLAESGGKDLVRMKSDYDGGTALHWLCMCMDSHFAVEEKIRFLLRIGGRELLAMEEHLGQTALHLASSKLGVSQTILQLLDPSSSSSSSSAGIDVMAVDVTAAERLARAKKKIERLSRENKDLKEKVMALEVASTPKNLEEMEKMFDALVQNKISNLGAKVEILMDNWISTLESRLGMLSLDDPDTLIAKCTKFEAL